MSNFFIFLGWKTLFRNIGVAVWSEIVGSLCFGVFLNVSIMKGREIYLEGVLLAWMYSMLIALIPTLIGGAILSFLLNADLIHMRSTKRKSVLLGGIIGGSSVIVIDIVTIYSMRTGGDPEITIYALVAIAIGIVCGGWTAIKIFDSLISNTSEVTK